ncbi:MAG: hypothetical protein M1832_000590 [Thelocarpon impressellum]|nr:MAG: hypothetical protein M1832_000590 [Thelocarpon impressellum]
MNPSFSPADSLLSAPSESYPSLFDDDGTMSPAVSALTPRSLDDDGTERESSNTPQPSDPSDKKPVKKRKSWGQELPTPKTNLPPRKRAKTEDEKEQRRIERVLRNRAAAQSSRERKRKEVEGLEDEKRGIERSNSELAMRLRRAEMENEALRETVAKMAAEMTVFRKMAGADMPTPEGSVKAVSPAVPAGLFPADAVPAVKIEFDDLDFSLPPPQPTVDPRDANFSSPSGSPKTGPTAAAPNMTQHPAEMLCDLQCQLGATRLRWGSEAGTGADSRSGSRRPAPLWVLSTLCQLMLASMLSAAASTVLRPMSQISRSLATSSPLSAEALERPETLSLLILWLTSTATPSTSTMPSTSSPRHWSTSRITLLRRLLASSPALARPLRDATGRALRLMSSGCVTSTGATGREGVGAADGSGRTEALMGMMWVVDQHLRESGGGPPQRGAIESIEGDMGRGSKAGGLGRSDGGGPSAPPGRCASLDLGLESGKLR